MVSYQLDPAGSHIRHTADNVIGHRHQLGRRRLSAVNDRDTGMGGFLDFDDVYQRLFMIDGAFGGPPGNRIVVWDAHPDRIEDYPVATHVLGQPDFETRTPGGGRKKFGGGYIAVDDETQRLFKLDGTNNRVLVFDIHPDRIESYADAALVIGQPNFRSTARGLSRSRIAGPAGLALDPDRQHLYVSDRGNNRIVVFDIHPDRLENFPDAIAVIGQPDFETGTSQFAGAAALAEERTGLTKVTPEGLGFDNQYKRLFISQPQENRVLIFDLAELNETQNPDAVAVIGQPDYSTFDPIVSRSRIAWPKPPVVDSEKQRLYISEGFEGGNRVITFDIHPDRLTNGVAAVDVIGHINDRGDVDYERRNANDRLNGRFGAYVRAVALDTVDHRLFAADEYNNRVLVYQLDAQNRLLDRDARWVFGQKDVYSAESIRTASNLRIPLAVTYDNVDKRLYVGDSWHDRIVVFEADPELLGDRGGGYEAVAVLGQADFVSQDSRPSRNRMDFAVTRGRGIASSLIPVGIAIDERGRRAFVSDGGNNRVLVFDIAKERLQNGADALAVLGQSSFTSREIELSDEGMSSPGHLAYDPDHDRLFVVDSLHHRVLVFDVAPENLSNGMAASRVIGQPDFVTTTADVRRYLTVPTDRSLPYPNGIVYDTARQRLYVTDRGNDRVMVFDAAPGLLENYPRAVAVLGQRNAESHSSQVDSDSSGQDQLYDPRGMAIDSENQLLYTTDSHFARIVAYNFPEPSRRVSLPAGGAVSFSSLDPYMALDPWEPGEGFVALSEADGAQSSYVMTRTRFETEAMTERLSRQLISQTAAPAAIPSSSSLVLVEGRDDAVTTVFLANPGDQPALVRLVLRAQEDEATTSVSLEPGSSSTASVVDLFGEDFESGALSVESDTPVAVAAWYERQNRHGEQLSVSLPVVRDGQATADVLANAIVGGGYKTEVVLLNPNETNISGMISLFDEDGNEVASETYSVAPKSRYSWEAPGGGAIPERRYVVAQPASGGVPALAALVSRSDDGLITATSIESFELHTLARVPVDTMPNLIRHRRSIETQFTVANPGLTAATVRFILRDLQGSQVERYEQTVLPGFQRTFSLADLFDRREFAGSVGIVSDVAVGLSARMATVNLRGEEILTELPVLSGVSSGTTVHPYLDGAGTSTEWVVSAGGEREVHSTLEFFTTDGEAMDVIVR